MPCCKILVAGSALRFFQQVLWCHTSKFRNTVLRKESADQGESGRLISGGLCRIPEISHLNIQLCYSAVDVLSNRALSVDRERGGSGPLDELTSNNCVWLPRVAFQFDFNMPLLFRLFYEGVQILAPKNLGGK